LMRLTLTSGAIGFGADGADVEALAEFGQCLGNAYQIYDDLLDEFGESAQAGKTVGQDARHLRPSFAVELGVEEANRMAADLIERAKAAVIDRFGDRREARLLASAADFIIRRAVRVCPVSDLVV